MSGGRGTTTYDTRGNAVNGHTEVTEKTQAAGSSPRRGTSGPRRAAAAGSRRAAAAAPAPGRQPHPAEARSAGTRTRSAGPRPTGARPANVRPGAARSATARPAAPPVPRRGGQGSPSAAVRTARPALAGHRPAPESRTRFVFLVVGLLGGGLVCLLIINTILASGAFQITALQQDNVPLAQRVQTLQAQIAAEESPASLAHRAAQLGMQMQPRLRFLNLSTGRLQSQPGQMPGIPTVPGYTP